MKKTVDWAEAQRVCDLPAVDEMIKNLLADQTGDNATCLVRQIMEEALQPTPDFIASLEKLKEDIIISVDEFCDGNKLHTPHNEKYTQDWVDGFDEAIEQSRNPIIHRITGIFKKLLNNEEN